MQLNSIKPKAGSTKSRKRVGRGNASGHGTFSGRGCKGAGQRKSPHMHAGFEGGQTPITSRLPKLRGFNNVNKQHYQVVNVGELEGFKDGEEVNLESLLQKKLIRKKTVPVKLLGDGKITKKLNIRLHKVSQTAKEKVMTAGGKILA